jgi:acetyl-CoA C-acetyltransferase
MNDDRGIVVSRRGQVLEITIARESKANSLDADAHRALDLALDRLMDDPGLRVGILAAGGDRFFCAGQDLTALTPGTPVQLPANGFGGLTSRTSLEKPIVAAVDGLALGGGMELVLACHLAVASSRAQFALSEVLVGMVAAAGGIARLPGRIPPAIAHELILTGRRMGADEALRWGLVNRVVEPGAALDAARELADGILAASPTSVRLSLRLLDLGRRAGEAGPDPAETLAIMAELMGSADTREALAAFAARRLSARRAGS